VAEGSHITDEMRAMIGKESEPEVYEVDKTGVRMFARAIGYTDRVFYDEEYAKAEGYRSLPAPPGFLGTAVYDPATSNPTFSRRRTEGLKTPLKRLLNGGNEFEYHEVICAGDVLTMTEKITDIKERTGGMGAMLITTREQTYRNQDGRVVAIARGTTINY
jgi:acyl dehydratase